MAKKNHKAKKPPDIPKTEIESLARRLYPAILKYFESEEGQKKFEEWKANKKAETS